MKAKELAEELLKNPDFEVELIRMIGDTTYDHPYPEYETLKIFGVADVGYSDKVIILDCE